MPVQTCTILIITVYKYKYKAHPCLPTKYRLYRQPDSDASSAAVVGPEEKVVVT